MPGAVRKGDMSTGHPHCYPPTPCAEGSPNVFVNGRQSVRIGDAWVVHGACEIHVPHSGVSSSGSGSVFVNGRAKCRIGDAVSCGDSMAEGSGDVIVGG